MAMGHNLWLHFGRDEHPFATYFDVHQGYRVLTHGHICIGKVRSQICAVLGPGRVFFFTLVRSPAP